MSGEFQKRVAKSAAATKLNLGGFKLGLSRCASIRLWNSRLVLDGLVDAVLFLLSRAWSMVVDLPDPAPFSNMGPLQKKVGQSGGLPGLTLDAFGLRCA